MTRTIAHCDLDAFFVSVERLLNRNLIGKPVLIGSDSGRGVVAACSYEARRFGVHAAMPMKLARRLCPEAILVRGDFESYTNYSNLVTEIIEESVPVVEKSSIDEHYLDMTGMDRFFGTWKYLQELQQQIVTETGLPISFGLATSKTVSKIAAGEAKPSGARNVEAGFEKRFLAPLSIRKIPGIGIKTYPLLRNMGISRILTLQQMDAFTLKKVLGKNGITIWNKANGIDNSEVVSFQNQKSMSRETTFEEDTIDEKLLQDTLLTLVDELAFELRKDQKLTSSVSVKIRYSNFDTHTRQAALPFTASERVISEKVLHIFRILHNRRMRVRLLGIRFNNLITGNYQIDLFEDTQKDINLSKAMDQIRMKYGSRAVVKGFSL